MKRIKAALALLRGEKAQNNFEALNLADYSKKVRRGKGEGGRIFKKSLSLFAIFLVVAFFFSCKSAPVEPSVPSVNVNAFDTLEEDSFVYIRIPVISHKELSANMLNAVVGSEIQGRYVKHLVDNIQTVYVASGCAADRTRLQIACDGSVSAIAKMGLAGADNWDRRMVKKGRSNFSVYTEMNSKIELCLPGSDLILLSYDLEKPLERYDAEAYPRQIFGDDDDEDDVQTVNEWKTSEVYKFVGSDTSPNVHIYMTNPLSFVARLLGISLSSSIFQLNCITADVKKLPNGHYTIDLDVEFSKPGLVARAASFLNVAFLLTGSSITVVDDTHARITDIQVSLEQLQKILGI